MDILNLIRSVAIGEAEKVKGKMIEVRWPDKDLLRSVRLKDRHIVSNPHSVPRPQILIGTIVDVVLDRGNPNDPVAVVTDNNETGYLIGVLSLVRHLHRVIEPGYVSTLEWKTGENDEIFATSCFDGHKIIPSPIGQTPKSGSGLARFYQPQPGDKESVCLVLSDNDSHWIAYPSPSNSYQSENDQPK